MCNVNELRLGFSNTTRNPEGLAERKCCVVGVGMVAPPPNVNVNVNELRLGFSNTTRNAEGIVDHNNRKGET